MMIPEMKGLTKTCNTGKEGQTKICMHQLMILYHTGRVRKKTKTFWIARFFTQKLSGYNAYIASFFKFATNMRKKCVCKF